MAVDTVNFHGSARLAVDLAVAMIVLRKVAIATVHALLEVNVRQMHGFAEPLRIVEANRLAILVEPIPFAVMVVDGAKNPAVSVKIGKLRGLQLRVEFLASQLLEKRV